MASVRIGFQKWLETEYEMTLEELSECSMTERQRIYDEYEQETSTKSKGGVPGWIC